MMNRLAEETSPYLLQHKDNPVDWYPWSPEALERAKAEDKPIFLSIGYSACHWCHVMEHESFENASIAETLNRHFVCMKVDREERPDLDHIYMQAVQMITGRGGWPLSAFLTPDLQPFFGGTYWPPTTRMGMPGFDQVLAAVIDAWANRREQAVQQAAQLTAALEGSWQETEAAQSLSPELLATATERLGTAFDPANGGFGRAPKFPRPLELQLLLRVAQRQPDERPLEMVRLTLDKMAAGGLYDHLGGGFARYSVDEHWLVPHFEKMLYDNALLADAYLDGYIVTGSQRYLRVIQESLDYVLRDMVDTEGGFHSTEDADSEGEEGKYYVWTIDEIHEVLGPELGNRFCDTYGVTSSGNFEGKTILNLTAVDEAAGTPSSEALEAMVEQLNEARRRLFERRQQRVRPGKDDKILVSWNGLMIHAMARAAGVLGRDDYLQAAQHAARFLLTKLRRADGRLLHAWRLGAARFDAYLDDYAYLANSLVTLYEADFDERWIDHAVALCDTILQHFRDPQQGGFHYTADDHEALVTRTKEWYDSSVPSSNAMAATVLLRLGKLTGNSLYLDAANETIEAAVPLMRAAPEAFSQMLIAADLALGPAWELALVSPQEGDARTDRVLQSLRTSFLPRKVIACRGEQGGDHHSSLINPLFAGKPLDVSQPTLHVCEGFACGQPIVGEEAISDWIARAQSDITA